MAELKRYHLSEAKDLSTYPFAPTYIPYPFAKEKGILPLQFKEGILTIAISNPLDLEAVADVRMMSEVPIEELYAPREAIDAVIDRCYGQGESEALLSGIKEDEEGELDDVYDLFDQKSDSPIIRILNAMIIEAVQQGASDIHFEPSEKGLTVRYRIDGVLQKRHAPPREFQKQLITRIKVMAKLDIAQQRLPQDGRIKLKMAGREIDFRVSTVPIVYGERVVLRILDKGNVVLGLEELHMPHELLAAFRSMITRSQGIVLVTGPTGSGKTTTLYSALSEIVSSEVNVMTIEDPVEYKLPLMAQIGVNPKINLTFAAGLRTILRQDPDVIMIGEIRDLETAEIAIQSSLTGHLVFSTLHTNSAPGAITRLIDMGLEPYLLASSIVGVLAQRLVRTLCVECREAYTPDAGELADLGVKADCLYRSRGCEACYGTGYRGRRGIYELMPIDTKVREQMLAHADSEAIKAVANMVSLREHGAQLALEGYTSSAEVLRVTR